MFSLRVRKAIAPVVAVCCAGCQVYTPVTLASQAPAGNIRLTLTDQGAVNLAKALGGGATQLEGHVEGVTDSTIVIRVAELTRLTGFDEKWSGEPVSVARGDVATVERRSTSLVRSLLVGGAIVGGAVLAGSVAGSAIGGSSTSPPVGVK